MLLFKLKKKTPGARWRTKLKTLNVNSKLTKQFILSNSFAAGRNNSGKITVRHKKHSLTKSQTPLFSLTKYLSHGVGLVVSFLFTVRKFKLFALIKHVDGAYIFLPATANVGIGSLFFCFNQFIFNLHKNFSLIFFFFYQLQKFFVVSFMSTGHSLKPSLATASGCYAQLLNFLKETGRLTFQLPSGKIKFFFAHGCCFLGRAGSDQKKNVILGKAGISINSGVRPTVRGNAMNPVDHPQGGRTKAKQPEKSPWGWVSKHNK